MKKRGVPVRYPFAVSILFSEGTVTIKGKRYRLLELQVESRGAAKARFQEQVDHHQRNGWSTRMSAVVYSLSPNLRPLLSGRADRNGTVTWEAIQR